MTVTIRTADPRELLALIPYQMGFQPRESAVLLSLRPPRSRIGLMARVDLGDLARRGRGPELARNLVGHLVADGAYRAIVVLYTTEDLQRRAPRSGREKSGGTAAFRALAHMRAAAGGTLGGELECWVVTPNGYFALGCADPDCCPPGGRPISELQATRVGAQMVLDGVQVVGSREQLVNIPPASATARKSARRARARWDARGRGASTGADVQRWRAAGLSLWREEFGRALAWSATQEPCRAELDGAGPNAESGVAGPPWQPPPATVVGRLQAALDDVLVRDAVLLAIVGADVVADRVVAGDSGPEVGRALEAMMSRKNGTPPDRERSAAASRILQPLVSHASRRGQAPALTLLAVLSWWAGDGVRSGVLVERSLRADPEYRLATLVEEALLIGMPPGWVTAGSDHRSPPRSKRASAST